MQLVWKVKRGNIELIETLDACNNLVENQKGLEEELSLTFSVARDGDPPGRTSPLIWTPYFLIPNRGGAALSRLKSVGWEKLCLISYLSSLQLQLPQLQQDDGQGDAPLVRAVEILSEADQP